MYPAPTSNKDPVSSLYSLHNQATKATTYSGLNASTSSFAITVSVILVPAIGAIVLTLMLFFSPSLARV